MRRRSDSWLNATQILKVANVEKGKRTKILEKEILTGEHEKVQGGYGRYQGTWINYKRGRDFCRAYGVEELLRPLLEYDMGQDGTQPGKGTIETPTKEQAMAAQRKRSMYNNPDVRANTQTPNGTFFRNISSTAANAVNAISKARFDSPGPRPGSGNKRMSNMHRSSQQQGSQESQYFPNSQKSVHSIQSEPTSALNSQIDPLLANPNQPSFFVSHKRSYSNMDEGPPKKRARPSSSTGPTQQTNGTYSRSARDSTPTEPNESFMYPQIALSSSESVKMGLAPLPAPETVEEQEKQHLLASLFLDSRSDESPNSPDLSELSGEDLDIPMDNSGHTALHWAASLAKLSILKYLIQKGANIFRVNSGGETALMRAAMTTNNLDQNSFFDLLGLLGPTIEMRDSRGRTVLHHIAISSGVKGRGAACRYYLHSILEFVVIQGSATNSQQNSFNGDAELSNRHKPIGLVRFMSEIVNAQDMAGDTALNLAARIDSKSVIHQLLEVGANPCIPNFGGLRPTDFGVGGEAALKEAQNSDQNGASSSQQTLAELSNSDSSKEVIDRGFCFWYYTDMFANCYLAISSMLKDAETSFGSDIKIKQSVIDQTQTILQEEVAKRNDDREKLAELEAQSGQRSTSKRQRGNLRWAINEARTFLTSSGASADSEPGADLAFDESKLPENYLSGQNPETDSYLATLPPSHALEARVEAMRRQNAVLEERVSVLNRTTSAFEQKVRNIVALGTQGENGAGRARIEKLIAAVESEGGSEVDLSRVRDFLRRMASDES